jgi:hypothetical protein
MFTKFTLDNQTNTFDELSTSIEFENILNGRKGANLIDYKNNLVPIVRTTTNYNNPIQKFLPIHYDIIENIKKISNIEGLELNNALIEIYDNQYRTMGFHSDQALDLVENSYICIFSCYDHDSSLRKLKIKEKSTNKESEILLDNNSIIIFSTETNKNYVHKIILETNKSQNKWLGITFRLSKTFVQFVNEIPHFYKSDTILRIANQEEIIKFRKLKGDENSKTDYNSLDIDYTISVSDTLQIK